MATCAYADDSHILPLFFVRKARSPVCFSLASREENLQQSYRGNKTVWAMGEYFNFWPNGCLILDNCTAHGNTLSNLDGVEYIFLPANVASVFQPMEMGLLRDIKMNSRKHVLEKIVTNLENYQEL